MSLLHTLLFRITSLKIEKSPILIIGQGRSGTTILQNALSQNPVIISTPKESPLIGEIGKLLYTIEKGPDARYFINSSNTDISEIKKLLRDINFKYGIRDKMNKKNFLKFCLIPGNFFKKKYWLVKTFPTEISFTGLQQIYPNLKAIYIFRNGIDQIHSSMKHINFKGKEFIEYCNLYKHHEEKYRYLKTRDNVYYIKHEDLVIDPEKELKNIYKFLKIPYFSGSLKLIQSTLIHPLDNPKTLEKINTKEILLGRPSPHLNWSEEEKALFKDICKEAMHNNQYTIPY